MAANDEVMNGLINGVDFKLRRIYFGVPIDWTEESAGDFKIWAREMINSVGKNIKNHLPKLYKELGGTDTDVTGKQARINKQIAEYERQLREGVEIGRAHV